MKELLLHFVGKMRSHRRRTETKRSLFGVCCALLLMMFSTPLFAQSSKLSGRVTDATGTSLPGVSVVVKGTATGTQTDVNGHYELNVPDANATVQFSFVGYTMQEIKLNGRKTLDVQMHDDTRNLNEVVVIGYQTVRKKDLTGAVAVISPAESNKVSANSLAESLQGLSPGVTVRNGGAPGGGAQIEIRGVASLISAAPLYVIDGMIADANTTVNNNDVESIQVLKDASAAAIYGSRAANGVIIVTTKKGKAGEPKVTISAKYGAQRIPKQWDVMNATQYAATKKQEYINSGLAVPASVGTAFNPNINTNWQDLDQRTGNYQDYNLTYSGGTDHSNFLVSGSYYKNEGVLKAYNFNRASLRVNSETKKGRLTFGENVLLTSTNNYHPNRGNAFYDLPQLLPTLPVQDPRFIDNSTAFSNPSRGFRNPQGWSNGTVDNGQDVTYAWNSLAINDLSQGYNNFAKVLGNAYAQLRIFDWLDYKFNVGLEASFDYNRDFRKDGTFSYAAQQELSYIDEDNERFRNVLLEHTLNFNKKLKKHSINGVLGYTQQSYYRHATDARKTDLPIYNGSYLTEINAANGTSAASGQVVQDDRIHSYLGRLNYSYADKYLITASGRIDQDSRFGPDYRTGFFPSVAAGWRISKEKFFKADWIDDLKLNGSYGVLGINTIASFQNVGLINNSTRAVFAGDQIVSGAYQAQLYNADLRWEKRKMSNIGFDATLLHNRLTVSASVYRNISEDVLVNQVLPQYLGNARGNPVVNAASLSNKGIEVEATYRNSDHKFKWSLGGNVTTIKNKVLSVGNQGKGVNYIQQGSTRTQIGYPLGQWYVLKELGIFQSQAEINAYKRADGTVIEPYAKPGDIKFYADPNGKGTLNNNDRQFYGSPWPTLQTGLQFNGSYKQFSVNVQMVGIFGLTIYNDVRRALDGYQNSNFRTGINPWSPTNTGGTDPRLGIANGDAGIANNNTPESSRWLENGSYGRIRNLEFGYMLPGNVAQKWHMSSARIFVSGQNLLTVTKYKGLDPDLTGNGLLQRGVDSGNWPSSRVFSIGINCGF